MKQVLYICAHGKKKSMSELETNYKCLCSCLCVSVCVNVTCVSVYPCLCGHNWDVVRQGNTSSIFFIFFFYASQPVRDRNGCFCLMKASKQRSSVCFDKGNVHASE